MKPLIPILVVATTSLAVASVQFYQQGTAQRARADKELQLRQKQEARVVELERNQARLERELMMARAQGAAAGTQVEMAAQRPTARPPGLGAFAAADAGAQGGPPPPFEARRGRGPLDSPAAQNFIRSRLKNQMRRLYGDAGQALGLSAEKGNQLLDLIADQQTRNFGMGRQNIPDGESPQQYYQEQQKKNQEEIKAVIGADKMDGWAAYQKSLPQRAELGQVRDQLDQAGLPMSDSQRTEMLAAITEEQQRLPRPTISQGVAPEEMGAQIRQWQSDYDKAVLDRAKNVLSSEQYSAYKEYQDWQSEMRANIPALRGGPNGAPGVTLRSFTSGNDAAMGGPAVNFTMAVPAPAPPPPAQTQRK